jgi:RNA-directed DNA polymerase
MENVRIKQVKLSELAKNYNKYGIKVIKLQEELALTLEFRLLAVYNVTNNEGSKTPGVDGIILLDEQAKINMVKKLKDILILNKKVPYKSALVKRVFIPKTNGKFRPLGIPSIRDRCLQELLKLILDPLVEPYSDTHSYGFRKYRSAKNAIGAIRVALMSSQSKDDKYILDADILGFFDHISHF